jgi:glycosyltransferase involved in cell wall biosynthesis
MNPPQLTGTAKRHVLMTADTVGGVWTYGLELCRGLQRHDTRVTLFSMGRMPDDAQREEVQSIGNITLMPTPYRLEWMPDCERDLVASGELLLGLEQQLKPDVVHVNGFWHAALPFGAPVLSAAHSCVPSWWRACRKTALPPEWSAYRDWVRDAVNAADMMVAPTQAFFQQFQELNGTPTRARVIYNGRDPARFQTGPKHMMVLAAGRLWDEAKNIGGLCKAAGQTGIRVAVAGDTAAPDGDVISMDHVAVLGRLTPDELAQWMAKAAIFVSPARYEPFGLTILEAGLSSCALVLGDIPTLRELWDGAALFVHPEDEDALGAALRGLTADPARTAELGQLARARAEIYSTEKMAAAYDDAYGALCASNVEAVA